MDEMDLLKEVLAEPAPSSGTVSKGRRELQQLIRHQSRARTRRHRWSIAGIGLTATAATAAVTGVLVITFGFPATGPGAPVRSTAAGHHPATAEQSAQQILLTAAASAQRAPAGSGTYWYVRVRAATGNGNKQYVSETWTKRDGQTWIRSQKTGNKVIELSRSATTLGPFFLGGRNLTFGQIQNLPANPAALTNWIVTNAAAHGGKSGGPAPSRARQRADIFDSLTSLLSELPATPQVRAAAFRALAVLPGVTSLGHADGGQAVRFTLRGGEQATLIVDPAAGQIRATNFFVDNQGAEYFQRVPNATITTRWTGSLPPAAPRGSAPASRGTAPHPPVRTAVPAPDSSGG